MAEQFAELLEASGVDSIPELSHRVAENLHAKMVEVNEKKTPGPAAAVGGPGLRLDRAVQEPTPRRVSLIGEPHRDDPAAGSDWRALPG